MSEVAADRLPSSEVEARQQQSAVTETNFCSRTHACRDFIVYRSGDVAALAQSSVNRLRREVVSEYRLRGPVEAVGDRTHPRASFTILVRYPDQIAEDRLYSARRRHSPWAGGRTVLKRSGAASDLADPAVVFQIVVWSATRAFGAS